MFFIRRFEETLLDLFSLGKLVGTTHTYIGQEANAVGLIDHLEPERDVDLLEPPLPRALPRVHRRRVRPPLRGHGEGAGRLRRQGRQPAPVQGQLLLERRAREHRPGRDRDRAAEKTKGTGAVSTVFLGDGTLGEGVAYESLNIASLWKLPVLFVVENNHYAQSTPVELELAGSIAARGAAFGVETDELDTTDVEEIHEAAGPRDRPASARPARRSSSC